MSALERKDAAGTLHPGVRSAFRVQGSGFRWVQGSGLRIQGSEFRVQGSGFRVQVTTLVATGLCAGGEGRRGTEGREGATERVSRRVGVGMSGACLTLTVGGARAASSSSLLLSSLEFSDTQVYEP